jgi:hypothetical protein
LQLVVTTGGLKSNFYVVQEVLEGPTRSQIHNSSNYLLLIKPLAGNPLKLSYRKLIFRQADVQYSDRYVHV